MLLTNWGLKLSSTVYCFPPFSLPLLPPAGTSGIALPIEWNDVPPMPTGYGPQGVMFRAHLAGGARLYGIALHSC